MSKKVPAHVRAACHRKKRYSTAQAAREAASTIMTRLRFFAARTYRCKACGGWHLASPRPRQPRRVKR